MKEINETIFQKAEKVYNLISADPVLAGQTRQTETLIEKLESGKLTVSVIGQFKRGKSALSNAILGDEIMPVGIVPITSAVTKVYYGEKSAEVRYINGAVEKVEFSRLSEFISEQENADNRLGVGSVVIHAPSPFLKEGLVFVDTPGVGSFHKNNTETAYRYMKESDAVIFLLSVDSPINQIEIDFLQKTGEFAGKFYFVVNKIDVVDEKDLHDYVDYCQKLLCRLTGTEDIRLFPLSAKTGKGVDALKNAIIEDSVGQAGRILEESTAKKLRDVIGSCLRQLDFYWKAMNMEYKELDERFEEISKTFEDIKAKAESADSLYEIHLNEIKLQLSAKVMELFGMEYDYDIEQYRSGLTAMDKEEFMQQVELLTEGLRQTLDQVLLYREENAYTVIRRINAINKLSAKLRKIRDKL